MTRKLTRRPRKKLLMMMMITLKIIILLKMRIHTLLQEKEIIPIKIKESRNS